MHRLVGRELQSTEPGFVAQPDLIIDDRSTM
jgi:hypothetical protein